MAGVLWTGLVKFMFYTSHILINFLIFFFISMRLRYAFIMLAATLLILSVKVTLWIVSKGTITMPMQLPLYIDVILIFSLAGYFIAKRV